MSCHFHNEAMLTQTQVLLSLTAPEKNVAQLLLQSNKTSSFKELHWSLKYMQVHIPVRLHARRISTVYLMTVLTTDRIVAAAITFQGVLLAVVQCWCLIILQIHDFFYLIVLKKHSPTNAAFVFSCCTRVTS